MEGGRMDSIDELELDGRTKGIPLGRATIRVGEIGRQGWNILRGDLPFPLLTLKDSALRQNLGVMREFAELHGVSIAPHAKTTGAPQLYRQQIVEGGAWGMTAATCQQAAVAAASGIAKVLLANELVAPANVAQYVRLTQEYATTSFFCLIDSVAGAERLARFARPHLRTGQRLAVLLEVGAKGGRAGARTPVEAEAVIRAILAAADALSLVGVECYEGAVSRDTPEATLRAIDALLDFAADSYRRARDLGAFDGVEETLLSAGGSMYFDEVTRRWESLRTTPGLRIVLRPGAYLAHDHGFYRRSAAEIDKRGGVALRRGRAEASKVFVPALELWAAVQTLPDPGVAIMSMGMRDLPYDIDLPIPLRQYRDGAMVRDLTVSNAPFRVFKSNDQHCFMSYPEGADIAIGDVVSFGVSHTSTAFDKWSVLYRVDDEYTVTGAIKTAF
jgi:D-serine dehydratase